MKIHFIGGAHEIGGSCSVVEVGGRRLLIDCGQKMGGGDIDRLPDLARVQELGPIDAILVTHAHADHIGALPLIHLAYPQAPIYTTEATHALMKVMLADSLRIMEIRWLQEAEIPLYPEHAVLSMLARVQTVPVAEIQPLCQGELQMTFLLSGHVLGACSLTLDTPEGRLFFTGDFSVDAQRTVDSIMVPKIRPHVVITEATYGNRMHANRKAEESRLAAAVAEVVAAGGKVLIPAFALGRAQEVLLILIQEQKAGRIPRFPIFVDGMVRNICNVYSLFPEYLGPRLKKQVLHHGNPFFYEGSPARAVENQQREGVVLGEPCCIVSSSGMLNGGPSQFYAAELAPDPKNAIFITGYQDEESPGAKVLALTEQAEPVLKIMNRSVRLACKVAKYNLSAHADAGQISSLLATLSPRQCYLVHGDAGARQALSQMLPPGIQVTLPQNGETAEFGYGNTVKTLTGEKRPKLRKNFKEVREFWLRRNPPEKTYTLAELFDHQNPSPEELAQLEKELTAASGFYADPQRPGLYRLTAYPTQQPGPKQDHGPLLQARKALKLVPEVVHIGWRFETRELLLHVPFPKMFVANRSALVQNLEEKLNVKVVVAARDTARHLAEIARKHLPEGARLTRPPSVFPHQDRVGLRIRFPDALETAIREGYLEKVSQETGYTVELHRVEDDLPAPRALFGEDGRMELNSAYRRISQALQQVGLTVFRCGRKELPEEFIEVGLVAPWLLEPHQSLVAQLEKETGYPIRAGGVNQTAIDKLLRKTLPPSWQLGKSPSFFFDRRCVGLRFQRRPDPESIEMLSEKFFDQVGLRLEVIH